MKVFDCAAELVGNTPLCRLRNIEKEASLGCSLLAKLECFNPTGSAKDRIAVKMLLDAEKSGLIKKGATVIEPTSGNTGIGLAAVCAAKGYKAVIVMPDTMSAERRRLIAAFGATLVLTDGKEGMDGAVKKAEQLAKSTENSLLAGQFYNPSNPAAHYETTGPEIYADTDGEVDIFVACVGTGGTLSGTGKYLKEKKKDVRVIAVEPAASPLLSEGRTGSHKIQGIGANFIPDTLDRDIYDEVITVTDEDAFACARELAAKEGLLCGISSGAALYGALRVAARAENKGKTVVVLLPDTGERYLSTELFGE